MRNKLKKFWSEPVNRFWLICAFGTLFALCFGTYTFFKESFDPVISLGLISVSLVFEVVFLIALIINTFADTNREYLEAFQEINRNLRYRHYQKKNKDKEYKGPNWDDDNFVKVPDLKERVDAFVKASIEYQEVDFKRWKKRNVGINLDTRSQTILRSFWILCAAIISIFFLIYLGWFKYLSADNLKNLSDTSRGFFTIPIALIGSIVAAPVIFVIWLFRDKNNRVQIENARKDTNLKDFQKLSEWASGFHLPEIKQTKTVKNELKTDESKGGTKKEFKEETESTEYFITPDNSNSISRRQGAEALQASSIAQLEAFMFGKYGEQFMQPAFLLLHAIWESIITQQQARYSTEEEFKKSLLHLYKNPIAKSLNKALMGAGGNHLRLFEKNLKGLNLTALDNFHYISKILNLNNVDLSATNFSYTILSYSQLQNARLVGTNLQGATIDSSSLQKANFNFSNLNHSNLNFSRLNYASLSNADLTDASLRSSHLQFANLEDSILRGANLTNANLQGTNLTGANLEAAIFKKAKINRFTLFVDHEYNNHLLESDEVREDILARGAIWDDDPNWLVGKIENQDLLNHVIKRSKDFASGYVFF